MRKPNPLAFAVIAAAASIVVATGAHAIPAIDVRTTVSPDDAVPSRDAVIPKNARLVAFTGNQGGGDFITFTRVHADGTQENLVSAAVRSDIAAAFVVDLGELSPAEGVSIEAGGFETELFTFTVADVEDNTAPTFDDNAPTLTITKEVWHGFLSSTADFLVEGCLPRISDDSATLLQLDRQLGETTSTSLLPVHATPECATPLSFRTPVAGSVCIDAVAVDVAGNESAALHVCGDVPAEATGCAQASSSAPSFAVAAVALALVRAASRRRLTRPVA